MKSTASVKRGTSMGRLNHNHMDNCGAGSKDHISHYHLGESILRY